VKRRLRDLTAADLRGRRALVRVDYNVPLDEDGDVGDATRIAATLPTLRYLLERGAVPVLMSHLGRPGGAVDPDLSLAPVAPVLERQLGRQVRFVGTPDTDAALEAVEGKGAASVILTENLRFHPGETSDDPEFARRVARLGDLYVNDAFGASHRSHASITSVARELRPAVMGLLVEREIEMLSRLRASPESPYVTVFGGAKISDKIGLIRRSLGQADAVLVGGGMANTLLAALGHEMGRSLVETSALDEARSLLDAGGEKLELPTDLVVASGPDDPESAVVVAADAVPEHTMALDVGPETRGTFRDVVESARTVFWNGPLGYFDEARFREGTDELAASVARVTGRGAFTVVGGGDSARAVRGAGVAERISHVSTGGGASIRFLAEGTLPGLESLEDA
jgi:phosphoglycerate kinase